MPTGRELHINANASRGRITAELLDAAGEVVPGFEVTTCLPFDGDSLDHTMRWTGSSAGDRHDANVSVRLTLNDAELFSLWFE